MATTAHKKESDETKSSRKKTTKADNYTDPELRERLKESIKAGEKGGKAGQWSARKAQLLTHEYEKEGGGYKDDHQTDSQKHLKEWTDQDWQTADGKPAKREGGTTRYLPKEAWDKLSDSEKKATNAKKIAGSKRGEQNVANTEKAKKAKEE
ncbi:hypothetical protein [Fibrella arboris]|uniref:hypothetical protein n=1 Tax=Fibrella arboris TaxID=3242486 RepID=UPI003520E5AA